MTSPLVAVAAQAPPDPQVRAGQVDPDAQYCQQKWSGIV
jgi:hypothetical protein